MLYILGGTFAIRFPVFAINMDDLKELYEIEVAMEALNVLTKVALVGVLNHVQVRNVARSGSKYWLLKGTLIVTLIFQICTLINMTVSFIFSPPFNDKNSFLEQIMQLLFLPIVTKIGALIWTKIWHDDKCIIVNNECKESNSVTRQNPRISNVIEII